MCQVSFWFRRLGSCRVVGRLKVVWVVLVLCATGRGGLAGCAVGDDVIIVRCVAYCVLLVRFGEVGVMEVDFGGVHESLINSLCDRIFLGLVRGVILVCDS